MEATYLKVGIMIISVGFNDCVELCVVCNIIYRCVFFKLFYTEMSFSEI